MKSYPSLKEISNINYILKAKILVLLMCVSAISFSADRSAAEDFSYTLPQSKQNTFEFSYEDESLSIPYQSHQSQLPITKGTVILLGVNSVASKEAQILQAWSKKLPKWGYNTLFVSYDSALIEKMITDKQNASQNPDLNRTDSNEQGDGTQETEQAPAQDEANSSSSLTESPTDDEDLNTETDPSSNQTSIQQDLWPQTGLKPWEYQADGALPKFEQSVVLFDAILRSIEKRFLQQAGYRILLSQGTAAALALHSQSKEDTLKMDANVVLSPFWPEPQYNNDIAIWAADSAVPLLDLTGLHENAWSLSTQEARRIQNSIKLNAFYRQRGIDNAATRDQTSTLVRELIGWTRYLGW